jgi:hypothetical protein
MKYEIVGITIVAKEIKEEQLAGGLLKKMLPIYEPVEIPKDAIAVTMREEVVAAVPPGTPRPPQGMEQALMKKYTKAICRITWLMPVKATIITGAEEKLT